MATTCFCDMIVLYSLNGSSSSLVLIPDVLRVKMHVISGRLHTFWSAPRMTPGEIRPIQKCFKISSFKLHLHALQSARGNPWVVQPPTVLSSPAPTPGERGGSVSTLLLLCNGDQNCTQHCRRDIITALCLLEIAHLIHFSITFIFFTATKLVAGSCPD